MCQHEKLVNLLYQNVNILFIYFCNILFICVHTSFSTPSIQFVTILELPILNSTNEHQCCLVKHLFSSILGKQGTKHIIEAQKPCYYCVFEKSKPFEHGHRFEHYFNTRGITSTDKCDAHLNMCIDQHIHN